MYLDADRHSLQDMEQHQKCQARRTQLDMCMGLIIHSHNQMLHLQKNTQVQITRSTDLSVRHSSGTSGMPGRHYATYLQPKGALVKAQSCGMVTQMYLCAKADTTPNFC